MFLIVAAAVLGVAVGQTYNTKTEARTTAKLWCEGDTKTNLVLGPSTDLDINTIYELFNPPSGDTDHKCRTWDGKDDKVKTLDVSDVTNFNSFFQNNKNFNGDVSAWDVSKATRIESMFLEAEKFNQDLNSWQTSKVTEIDSLFFKAYSFNGDITSWDTSNVKSMQGTFKYAFEFNRDIGNWDVGNVATFYHTFLQAQSFYQPSIKEWNVMSAEEMKAIEVNTAGINLRSTVTSPVILAFYNHKYNKDAKTVADLEAAAGLSKGDLHTFEQAEVPKRIACFWSDVLRHWTKRNRLFTFDEALETGVTQAIKRTKFCGLSRQLVDGEFKSYCTYYFEHCDEGIESNEKQATLAGLFALGGVVGVSGLLKCLCSFRRSGGGGGGNYVPIKIPPK